MQICFDYDYDNQLTKEEETARDIMVNLFNPVLKLLLCTYNSSKWRQYSFNSCRQTAIFGAVYLKKLLPDYDIVPYEGEFVEYYDDENTENYSHCFIIASKNNRTLLIDLSRTTKRLIFHRVIDSLYPTTKEYSQMALISREVIDLDKMYYNSTMREYFTQCKPIEVMDKIEKYMSNLSKQSKDIQINFRNHIYHSFTNIFEIQ